MIRYVLASFALGACHLAPPVSSTTETPFPELHRVIAGTEILVCGWFETAHEVCAVTESQASAMFPAESHVWVSPTSSICDQQSALLNPRSGWANVSGRLISGYGLGHLGGYQFELRDARVEFRAEPCGGDQ